MFRGDPGEMNFKKLRVCVFFVVFFNEQMYSTQSTSIVQNNILLQEGHKSVGFNTRKTKSDWLTSPLLAVADACFEDAHVAFPSSHFPLIKSLWRIKSNALYISPFTQTISSDAEKRSPWKHLKWFLTMNTWLSNGIVHITKTERQKESFTRLTQPSLFPRKSWGLLPHTTMHYTLLLTFGGCCAPPCPKGKSTRMCRGCVCIETHRLLV